MNAPVIFDASGLAQVVERAKALLDDGDVIAARLLSSGAYDQAKAAAQFAERFGAADRLVKKARQLQGDALLIEARAKIRLAAEYDAAREAGKAAGKGRPKKADPENVPDEKVFTQAEAGLSAKDIHEARKLAAAEGRSPGIVERAIAARLMAGLEPSRANLRAAVGTSTATNAERGNNLYETPVEATRTLLALERFSLRVREPACGRAAVVRPFEDAGYDVVLSDLVDYGTADRHGEVQAVVDFFDLEPDSDQPDIVTNPPYGAVLNRFVAHALRVHRPRKMALLLNLNFVCGFDDPERNFAMDENPPARIHVFTRRLPMMHRDGWDGPEASSRMNTAWFVWEADEDGNYVGPTMINRVDWADDQDAPPAAAEHVSRASAIATPTETAPVEPQWHQQYEGDRILAKSGEIELGAVFPDGDGSGAEWSFWLGSIAGPHHRARTVKAAKAALIRRWREFLAKAQLTASGEPRTAR